MAAKFGNIKHRSLDFSSVEEWQKIFLLDFELKKKDFIQKFVPIGTNVTHQ